MNAWWRGLLAALLVACIANCGGKEEETPPEEPAAEPAVEMIDYHLGIIKKGPAWTAEETPEVAALQEQHLAHIEHLADSGVLALAGPFGGEFQDENTRSLFIYRVDSREAAWQLAQSDPAVQAGRLKVDIFQWRAPAILTYDDDYEMTEYYLIFYFKGPFFYAPETPPSFLEMLKVQTEKLPEICDSCRIALAGEFPNYENSYSLTGMIIYQAYSREQVDQILNASPAVKATHYLARIFTWYGPSALRMQQ